MKLTHKRKLELHNELAIVLKSYAEAIEERARHHDEISADRLFDACDNLALALVEFFQIAAGVD